MILSKRLLLWLAIFGTFMTISLPAVAQDSLKLDFGKFKLEDLNMKVWASDSSAAAAVLGEVGELDMYDGADYDGYTFKVHRRIKIFTKDGFDEANVAIRYQTKDGMQMVKNIKAHTITPQGKIVPVEKSAIITESIDKNFSAAKIVFPEITEGCVIEYSYVLDSRGGLLELSDWSFQDKIPTRMSRLTVSFLIRYSYVWLLHGKDNIKTIEGRRGAISSGGPYENSSDSHYKYTFYACNLPAIKKEPFVTSLINHVTRIRFQLSEYVQRNGYRNKIFETWNKLAEDLVENDYFGREFLKKSKYDDVWEAAKSVVDPADSARAKALKLYKWVNENFETDEGYNLYRAISPNDIFKKRRGNVNNLNLLLSALLKEAGLDAHPMLLSTRGHGKHFIDYPLADQFNRAVTYVAFSNEDVIILDAGNKNLPMGLPSEETLNGAGWVMKKKGQKWFEVLAPKSTKGILAKFDLNTEGVFTGTISSTYTAYSGVNQREIYAGKPDGENKIKYLNKNLPEWKINNLTVENLEDAEKPLKETITLSIDNAAQINDDRIYVKPTLQSGWETNPFVNEKRAYPVEMPYPINDVYSLILTIPEGFSVEELPKSTRLTFGKDDCKFSYATSQEGRKITLAVRIQINQTIYPVEGYPMLRNYFAQIAAKLGEVIVLKKESK